MQAAARASSGFSFTLPQGCTGSRPRPSRLTDAQKSSQESQVSRVSKSSASVESGEQDASKRAFTRLTSSAFSRTSQTHLIHRHTTWTRLVPCGISRRKSVPSYLAHAAVCLTSFVIVEPKSQRHFVSRTPQPPAQSRICCALHTCPAPSAPPSPPGLAAKARPCGRAAPWP